MNRSTKIFIVLKKYLFNSYLRFQLLVFVIEPLMFIWHDIRFTTPEKKNLWKKQHARNVRKDLINNTEKYNALRNIKKHLFFSLWTNKKDIFYNMKPKQLSGTLKGS